MKNEIIKSISSIYEDILFKDNFVDRNTGIVNIDKTRKLATYPFLGTKYGQTKKIMFIGLDMGKDETPQLIQSFEKRNENLEWSRNNHIIGTFFTTFYFLKDNFNFNDLWIEIVKNGGTFMQIYKTFRALDGFNPIEYISLSNYYKFVTNGRVGRSGKFDRKHLNQKKEEQLFLQEIEVLNPDIIIFQSLDFNHSKFAKIINQLVSSNRKVYIGPHPSHRKTKVPNEFIKLLREVK
ncbi:MAG: hypothetical protein H7239_13505 [Flavobacterium sp.]|nr:hypothetical protein [Flavobacterium sp.]